jgi:acyl-CoA thioesterase-1
MAIFCARSWQKIAATLIVIFGIILIVLSGTPLPYWLYAVAIGATLIWLVAERFDNERLKSRRKWLRGSVVVAWLICIAIEIPCHVTPTLVATGKPTFYVIGDSVTAGLNDDGSPRWPQLLARDHAVEVIDLAHNGATCSSAVKQADELPADGGLLLLEIGGNDLLGSTTSEKYARDLDQLLGKVCTPQRTVAMFELPLPPFFNEFGRTQRALAAKHGVILIPKQVFVAVLATNGATTDSIHLSPAGHRKMAETIWSFIKPAYEN